ncbi:hypothetical protein CHLRE_01g035650v5 [Chlamydomonas reinhardtii]|uniref:Uncharacterized protein n=1 Tax=Chlamydomonas reinhardtii TaxID=3055 RepID=A0A2K3E713_CHLRE|nr:uncharacterized protein CHLRE_01g035650v5 [Chlamydomonas reinhardtii]PNW88582.1 hypothetical protein CHLRE_01g035650v5 [Chlamydomonas reinhardtii]
MVFNRNNRKEISAIEDLIEAKIYVNPERQSELQRQRERLWQLPTDELPGGSACTLLCLNLSNDFADALRACLPGWKFQLETIADDPASPQYKADRKRFVKLFEGKALEEAGISAVVQELRSQGEELAQLDKRVIALSLLSRLPVISCCCSSADALPAAAAATGDTWPVFHMPHMPEDVRPLVKWLREELPRVRALSTAIADDLKARTAHLAKVNGPLHFLKRGAVAMVPLGVMVVNTIGSIRLMTRMLRLSGMRGDNAAGKSLGLLGASNAVFMNAIDSVGDLYSFVIFTTLLAEFKTMGLLEMTQAMEVVDGLTLGSISVVTGLVSAIGAYISRPGMVRAAASFLASLQTIYALNPGMRRESTARPPAERGALARLRRWMDSRRRGAEEKQALLARSAGPTSSTGSLLGAGGVAGVDYGTDGGGEESGEEEESDVGEDEEARLVAAPELEAAMAAARAAEAHVAAADASEVAAVEAEVAAVEAEMAALEAEAAALEAEVAEARALQGGAAPVPSTAVEAEVAEAAADVSGSDRASAVPATAADGPPTVHVCISVRGEDGKVALVLRTGDQPKPAAATAAAPTAAKVPAPSAHALRQAATEARAKAEAAKAAAAAAMETAQREAVVAEQALEAARQAAAQRRAERRWARAERRAARSKAALSGGALELVPLRSSGDLSSASYAPAAAGAEDDGPAAVAAAAGCCGVCLPLSRWWRARRRQRRAAAAPAEEVAALAAAS